MTPYAFDLRHEVSIALAAYADALEKVAFFDTRGLRESAFSERFGDEHRTHVVFDPGLTSAVGEKLWNHYISFGGSLDPASNTLTLPLAATGIFVGDKGVCGPMERECEFFMHFWHEIGHVVVPGASDTRLSENRRDCLADAFAAIHFLRQFPDDAEQLRLWSQMRTQDALQKGDWQHYTSPVVDAIIADHTRTSFCTGLKPSDIVAAALTYTDVHLPTLSYTADTPARPPVIRHQK